MTYLEFVKKYCIPKDVGTPDDIIIRTECPHKFDIEDFTGICVDRLSCKSCWNREITKDNLDFLIEKTKKYIIGCKENIRECNANIKKWKFLRKDFKMQAHRYEKKLKILERIKL